MAYDSKQQAIADGRCGAELPDGRGYCGGLPVSTFSDRDLSEYRDMRACRHHQPTQPSDPEVAIA